jgi:hypothetical protein
MVDLMSPKYRVIIVVSIILFGDMFEHHERLQLAYILALSVVFGILVIRGRMIKRNLAKSRDLPPNPAG